MSEPFRLMVKDVIDLHGEQPAVFGAPPGLRDKGLLESALARPLNRWNYESVEDLAVLAAEYAFGVARNHPTIDGNKRAAFDTMIVVLRLNGVRFTPDVAQSTAAMVSLAAGELDVDGLARWIRDNWPAAT